MPVTTILKRTLQGIMLPGVMLLLSACDPEPEIGSPVKAQKVSEPSPVEAPKPVSYREVEWTDLMPEEDLEALLDPPQEILDIPDGSEMDQISSQISSAIEQANDSPYQQALTSTTVVDSFNNQHIKIPGYIVPLDFDKQNLTTRFFLVPFFGACIHVPPPPPNQIILVDYPQGIKVKSLYDVFSISGLLKTSLFQHQMATSAYVMKAAKVEAYEPRSWAPQS